MSRFPRDLKATAPANEQPTIGIIGMGLMGSMYARVLTQAGWKKIHVCDRPDRYEALKEEWADIPAVTAFPDGYGVSRTSDFIMYSVEAEFIDGVVAQYGPSTKLNAVVAGQTSVKAPERAAFEKHLPKDVSIVSCHSLHGPTVNPIGQPLVLIKHRGSDEDLGLVENILRCFGSRFVHLSYEEHDVVTANTQAVTHAAFLSMGTAWASSKAYPWESGLYVGGIETVKVNLTLRIFSNAWHVYAGLAILNPQAREQINQYAKSATELFKMMIEAGTASNEAEEKKLRDRIEWARKTVFGETIGHEGQRRPILLSEHILDRFSLGRVPEGTEGSNYRPNSHLSLLAMVDCWAHLNINPFHHLSLAATPLFRLFLGVAEHLFLSQSMLDASIHSAIYDTWHRSDDLEFIVAARGWSQCVQFGSFDVYKKRFDGTRAFFEGRFEESGRLGSEMIKTVMENKVE
ncbi:prephenate dehydrogenase [Cylindrobasidium torrendii FP15055 ss-10]|uniref:Prephenate dehydrogenase [NADP(+)] n=1 Tax=Cylindrobasidium torrendii FP15055 ss-10 TaxID=1314674 RepID=A0A0D7BQE7_9AGAR|nr:prephenate dehydrogenase [Cylindrobasidium torrendii FP15055 ss-10]